MTNKNRTLYEVLDVMPDASEADIQQALNRAISHGRLPVKLLETIREHLLNSKKREQYDAYLKESLAQGGRVIIPDLKPKIIPAVKVEVNLVKDTPSQDAVSPKNKKTDPVIHATAEHIQRENQPYLSSPPNIVMPKWQDRISNKEQLKIPNHVTEKRNRLPVSCTDAWLSILLGSFGSQFFYQRKVKKGIVCVLFSWTLVPAIIGLIYGIYLLHTLKQQD